MSRHGVLTVYNKYYTKITWRATSKRPARSLAHFAGLVAGVVVVDGLVDGLASQQIAPRQGVVRSTH